MNGVATDDGLRDFLISRRSRLSPAQVGLVSTGARRVPGLRREEVAALAGVSVDYYARLERGRVRPSDVVLEALATALRLDDVERTHLRRLARLSGESHGHAAPVSVRPQVQRMLDHLDGLPAIVLNHRLDLLAWNALGSALIADFGAITPEQRNIVWLLFVDPATRRLYRQWNEVARDAVALLRLASAPAPDPETQRLVDNLTRASSDFRRMWGEHEVRVKTFGAKEFRHPVVGPITLQFESLALSDARQNLVLYVPGDGAALEALRLLAAWASDPAPGAADGQRRERSSN
jgi:transcriptional regulator with XRE-family HTH domain